MHDRQFEQVDEARTYCNKDKVMTGTFQEKEQPTTFFKERAVMILFFESVHDHIEDPPGPGPGNKCGQDINGGV